MKMLKYQKRLAADIMKCGKNRVWLDPNQFSEISQANSSTFHSLGMIVKKLIKDGLIVCKKVKVHSRTRARLHIIAKRKGRHQGQGKRRGTKQARMPQKVMWMRRQRVLRRLLRKYRQANKIDKKLYHRFYLESKGNQYKNKTVLIEAIHKSKGEKIKVEKLQNQQQARRQKNIEARKRKLEKKGDLKQ